jgi:hypothetical protein
VWSPEPGSALSHESTEQPPVRGPSPVVSPSGLSMPSPQQSERSGQQSSQLPTQKTITYDEVFENVRSEGSREKHFILQWPEKSNTWYILRCEKHDINFGEHVLSAARSHLHSSAHSHVPHTKEHAVRELGVLVLGCDGPRAERNNAAYKEALLAGYEPKTGSQETRHMNMRLRSRDRGNAKQVSSRSESLCSVSPATKEPRPPRAFAGIVDPIPGMVYQGAQQEAGSSELQWYLVVCLSLDDW